MRLAAAILTLLAMHGAAGAQVASAAPVEEVVLIGRSDLLAQNAPAPRRVSRIERYVAPPPSAIRDSVLSTLEEDPVPLGESVHSNQPALEQIASTLDQPAAPQSLVGTLGAIAPQGVIEQIPPEISAPKSLRRQPVTAATIGTVLLLMAVVALRRRIFGAINQLMLRLVVAVRHPGARIRSPKRRRRRRSTSRRRAPDVSWYFRGSKESPRRRGSRRRWSSAPRPREYVVTDVVYAAASAQAPRYLLLSNSLN